MFPLIEGERVVGRIDMKVQRDADVLQVTALSPQRRVKWSPSRLRKLESELQRVARFAGLSSVVFLDNWLRETP